MDRLIEVPNYDKMKAALAEYISSNREMLLRRKSWKNSVKDRLRQVLNTITQHTEVQLQVQVNEDWENYNSIILRLPNKPSGIAQLNDDPLGERQVTVRQFSKIEGYLSFNQTYNGKIVAVIVYPYVEELVSQLEPRVVGYFEPNELDINQIIEIVTTFINALENWEREERHAIGFLLKS